MKNIWILLSSKLHLQKIFKETGTLDKAAKHEAFQCEKLELGEDYVLSKGVISRHNEAGYMVYDVLKDLLLTLQNDKDPYRIMAQLINAGFKIEIKDDVYYYSRFYSIGKFPLDANYALDEAKRAIKASYKRRLDKPSKGYFKYPTECIAIIKDDNAFQQIVETELVALGKRIEVLLGLDEDTVVELIKDLYSSIDEVAQVRKKLT